MEPNDTQRQGEWGFSPRLIPGVILVGIGALFLLNNLHVVYLREWVRYWPVILIAVGIVRLVDSNFSGGRVAGGILIGLGAICLAQSLGYLYVRFYDLWPVLLIGVGLLMLFGRTPWALHRRHRLWRERYGNMNRNVWSNGTLDEVAVFSGGKRVLNSENFRGGQIVAIFGGVQLDLRKANMAEDSAILEIHSIFGGAEIQIPEHWSAQVRGVGIFGGFGDTTRQPDLSQTPGAKRLIVQGAAIFGGVDVKN